MSATKQRRTTTTTRTTRTFQSGGSVGGSSANSSSIHVDTDGNSFADVSSPLSPTRLSRVQEKETLSCLNDRLASYIDRVRQLESENNRLTVQIRDVEVIEKREKSNIRAAYEAELSDTRRLLDETSKQKAKIQIEADKARAEFDDLKAKIARLEKELKASETGRLNSDSLVQDLQARVNTAENRRKHAEDEAK
uniref:IF rod domain-containing protein n=1 Tax=Plectus sambesii TaxID=2011161 RepID=A0A914X3G0_9BILA